MYSYHVSKYDPRYRVDGVYQKDEWTAISDIGKVFDGKRLSGNEYLTVEKHYIEFVLDVCRMQNIECLTIRDIENYKKLSWHNGQQLDLYQSGLFVQVCLRDACWGRLVADGFLFEVGYEYYLRIKCTLTKDIMDELASKHGLFADEWEWEPYEFDITKLQWTREPAAYIIKEDKIEIQTKPYTDLWQRTYYHFRNDNAPVLQMQTDERFFSFTVQTHFDSKHRFDQCGIVMYLDSENWLKASVEYENERLGHLGSVVTNNGFSDWATTEIDASVRSMWYRLSRREDDYRIECSEDGKTFRQMRICHMQNGRGTIRFGIYACSPEDSSFTATFTDMELTECKWLAHDGQQPDQT